MSRSSRIAFLLGVDILFFSVELVVGYAVGSLALIADSFHMLNDVMSLIVALYAIKLSASTSADSRYSYGWHRAEILAALINGVFLLALCLTISLEAMQRFFAEPEIANPQLIVVVGSLGLASNILGLFLFHEHSHSHAQPHPKLSPPITPPAGSTPTQKAVPRLRSRSRSPSVTSEFSLYGHPAATRASLVQAANEIALARSPSPTIYKTNIAFRRSSSDIPVASPHRDSRCHEESPSLQRDQQNISQSEATPLLTQPGIGPHSHSHSHSGSMNMRALVLHVMGDALGNVGVIATGLVIWLTSWSFKHYFDPLISLVITVIIFSSALPLVRSASFILLQGVPPNISLDDVRDSILDVQGVLSLHELHVWQLSESKIVASVHVLASRDCDFMPIAAEIRKVFHTHGIHSSTIQPEYSFVEPGLSDDQSFKVTNVDSPCLILCPSDEACNPTENSCCPPPPNEV